MKLLRWIAGTLAAIVLVLFAVSNRTTVPLRIEPLPFLIESPLYVALLGSLVVGFLLGGIVAWLSGHKWRRRARHAEREVERLKTELAEFRKPSAATGQATSGPSAAAAGLGRLPYAS